MVVDVIRPVAAIPFRLGSDVRWLAALIGFPALMATSIDPTLLSVTKLQKVKHNTFLYDKILNSMGSIKVTNKLFPKFY